MAYLSIRCQRLQSLSAQRLKTSEVLEVMNDHDLMDLLRAKTDGDLDQLTFTLTSSANISGRSRLYSTLHGREKNQFNFEEPPSTRDERASSAGSKSTSLDLFPNIAAISSTDEIDLPLNDEEVGGGGSSSGHEDETKTPTSQKETNGNGSGGLSLFGGMSAMLAISRLSTKKHARDKEKEIKTEDNFSDIRPSEVAGNGAAAAPNVTPTSTSSAGPERKSFLQRAFGFISSETPNPPTSDPEEDDLEAGVVSSKRNSRRDSQGQSQDPTSRHSAGSNSSSTQQPPPPPPRNSNAPAAPPPPPSRNIVQPPQRNIVQPPQRHSNTQQPPPPPAKTSTDPSPPRPHTKSQSPKAPTPAASVSITDDMKRRHSMSTSRALAQEALRVAQARKTSLNERVSSSKASHIHEQQMASGPGLTYENIYPGSEQIGGLSEHGDEVVLENNDQLVGLHRHRESEIQRRSFISQSSSLSSAGGGGAAEATAAAGLRREASGDDDSEDEEDQFSSHTNPMISSSVQNNVPNLSTVPAAAPPTTARTAAARAAAPPPATNLRSLLSSGASPGELSFEPDNSARAMEKRRKSTRFPSIKGKREMFLLRSETGSSVSSATGPPDNTGDAQSAVSSTHTSSVTSKRSESKSQNSQRTGEGSGLSGISNTSPVTVESALSRRISRKFVGVATNEEFTDKVTQFYSYNDLKRAPVLRASSSVSSTGGDDPSSGAAAVPPPVEVQLPAGVNPKFREQYLSDLEFETIFNMSKSAFNAQPKWKKQELKKRHHLF